jgi:hypothetical protein
LKNKHNTKHDKTSPQRDRYEKNGVCQRKYTDFPQKYIGHRGLIFYAGYKEIYRQLRIKTVKSGYSNQILYTRYAYGSITDKIKLIKIEKK